MARSRTSPLDDAKFVAECAEGILNGLSNAVIGFDAEGRIKTCNAAGLTLLAATASDLIGRPAADIFTGENDWVARAIAKVSRTREAEATQGAKLFLFGKTVTVNATIFPLMTAENNDLLGTMVMLDEISAQRQMKSTIANYMSPDLVDRLLADGGETLKSKDTVATILFSDLRNFTSITEEIGAQKVVRLLNKYFTLMVDCINAENGAVDKFVGDALMAGFGITRQNGDEEDRAVRAGIAMLRALENWNAQRISEGRKPMQMGIGMATDLVVSGNIGSPKRMDYTLIGDGVNLASRLESACKHYGTRFLIAESTCRKLKGSYKIREIDEVIVLGRSLPVRIYEVLDHHTEKTFPHIDEAIALFAKARRHYIAGEWDKAIAGFWEVLALNPDDEVCDVYIDRCERLKANAPTHWNGVWTLETK